MVKLFLKNSNLCDHNSPTSQTDGRTGRQTTCDRNTALCTKVHRAVKIVDVKLSAVIFSFKSIHSLVVVELPCIANIWNSLVYHLTKVTLLMHLLSTHSKT